MTQERAYRQADANLELKELRAHNEELRREITMLRKRSSVIEYLKASWQRSDVAGTILLTLGVCIVTTLITASVAANSYRTDIITSLATEHAVSVLRSSNVEVKCSSKYFPGSSGLESCLARKTGSENGLIEFGCNETHCHQVPWSNQLFFLED